MAVFKRQRCIADSGGGLASSLGEAHSTGCAAYVAFLIIHWAFDADPHEASLRRLSLVGICVRAITYLYAFLSDQMLQVKTGSELSSAQSVTQG